MKNNTCFVVMPIGTQTFNGVTLTEEKLREKYDHIIKSAILTANPTLEVVRADDELNPASMSNDIFLKLMHSKYVIVDITYPNPNVFYELGIRHAISNKTILIKEKSNTPPPFDISHLRYIEYTQEPAGMSKLAEDLKKRFALYESNPTKADNQFLELCGFTEYSPSVYQFASKNAEQESIATLARFLFSNPELLSAFTNESISESERNAIIFGALQKDPEAAVQLVLALLSSQ